MRPGSVVKMSRYLLLAVVMLSVLLTFLPAPSSGQSVVYLIYTKDILSQFTGGNSTNVVMVGNTDQIVMEDPLIIVGSGIDTYEQRGLDKTLEVNYFQASHILNDTVTTFEGRNLTDYDLLLIGGPEHNAYTKYLCDMGILSYNETDKKMPAMIIEAEPIGLTHKALVVGDVAGYTYHKKDLPLNGIIPEQYAPVAAVVVGSSLGLLAVLLEKIFAGFNQLLGKIWSNVTNYVSSHASEVYGDKEAEIREIKVREENTRGRRRYLLGLTRKEAWLAVLAIFIFGFACLFAERATIDLTDILIYLLVGGVALVAHDIGHRIVAAKYNLKTEYQFWGYGTLLIILTSWLFGTVFAQPARTIIEGDDRRALALAFFTGPLVSIALAFGFMVLWPLGGTIGTIGELGFSMNLVNGLYMLMPFYPMDGKKVMNWNWKYWCIIFIPLLVFYAVITIAFL